MQIQNLIKGERLMSQGFIAQYAAEAALHCEGVASLEQSGVSNLKEAFGFEHEGQGVLVDFSDGEKNLVRITVYPVIYYGYVVPEVSWKIQETVKTDVEQFTGLICEEVNVHVKNIVAPKLEEPQKEEVDAKALIK